jgi:DNA-binding response OmpR family regulator
VTVPASGRRILLVEDEARIAEFVAKGLGHDGHDVVVAEDGDLGLFLATTEPFDAVVLDLALPGASGLEVLRTVHATRPDMPVIVLSGLDDPTARRACLGAGASRFLAKPLVVDELRATVNAQLRPGGSAL